MSKDGIKEQVVNKEKLKLIEKFSYGLGNLASNILVSTASTFITFFYTEVAGIGIAAVGTILLLGRILDGFTDIGMGIIVDKTNHKNGKARPWLLWLAVPLGFSLPLMFTSPNIGMTGKIIFAFVTYVLALGIIYTAINVPYCTLSALMTQDRDDRADLSVFRTALAFVGGIVLGNITLPMVEKFGGGAIGWQITTGIFGAIASVLFLICYINTNERIEVKKEQAKMPLKQGLGHLFKNKYWLIVIGISLCGFISSGINGINVYYAQYVLNDISAIGLMVTCAFGPIIISSLYSGILIKKFGKKNTYIISIFMAIIGTVVTLINPMNKTIVLAGLVIKGLGIGPTITSGFAMLGDTVEYGEWKTGVRLEGLIFSANSFGEKVGTGIGGMILGAILAAGGYVGGAAVQSEAAIGAIKFVFIGVPIFISLIQLILIKFYNLDKEYDQIVADLKERR